MLLCVQVVAGGLMQRDAEGFPVVDAAAGLDDAPAHAHAVFEFACAMARVASAHTYPHSGQPVKLRVGIHSGPIVSGVVGA
jgi:class 3 adenylate cyclase